MILDILKKCTSLDCAITSFHQELSFLPDVIQNIDIATESIGQCCCLRKVKHFLWS